jgi:hypothetical protein
LADITAVEAVLGVRCGGKFGAPSCEFFDSLHGGEVVSARMLQIAARSPGSALATLVDLDLIDKIVSEKAGYLIVPWFAVGKARADLIESASPCERYTQTTSNRTALEGLMDGRVTGCSTCPISAVSAISANM